MNDRDRYELLLARKKAIILSRDNLLMFAKYMSPDPDRKVDPRYSKYQDAKHHRVIAVALEEVEAGRIRRLMISCPPRHGKTRLASHFFPAWYVGRNPGKSFVAATYNDHFADEMGSEVRTVIRDPLYNQVFPEARLKKGAAATNHLQTVANAHMYWAGINGSLTGRGGDILSIDDPIKSRKEADSPVLRDQIWKWYTNVLRTRMMTQDGAIVIITTRWHEDDIVGRHLDPTNPYYNEEEASTWHVINLPALAEDNDSLGRQPGEALWPERFGIAYLEGMRRNDARGFTALYQGRPTPADGSFFKNDYVRPYNRMNELPALESMRFYGASDHAVATGQANDKSCLMVVGVDRDDDVWVMPDLIWNRMPSDYAVENMITLMAKYKPMLWWAERGQISKSIGPFLRKRMLERRIFCAIDEVTPISDKQQRAQSIHARMSMGKVHFPAFARWYADARDQILKFPQGTFDDFVDTLSLIGLGLNKQIPARRVKLTNNEPKPLTLGWIKEMTKRTEREQRDYGW